ncbi:signal peptidase I [Pontiellaceae bacterium B1224]|nr:signal peptidase I [Pontiellaceae bacterium B1224]
MVSIFKKRKLKKQLKEYIQMARHARHMREDIADPADLKALIEAEEAVVEIRRTGEGDVEKAVQTLEAAANKVYSMARKSVMMEWTETLIVALGAAMAIRAFFFQPFKIPTGSMQPTLNGINSFQQSAPSWNQKPPFKFVNWLITGESYKVIRAKSSGYLTREGGSRDTGIFLINGKVHKIPSYMSGLTQIDTEKVYKKGDVLIPGPEGHEILAQADGRINSNGGSLDEEGNIVLHIGGVIQRIPAYLVQPVVGKYYEKGDIILAGRVVAGDHILVNKMKYNFMSPERGDISVFDTRSISHPQVRADTFYIKRMVGLPGEKIQIQERRLVADGEIIEDPPMFKIIDTDPIYSGGHDIAPGSLLYSEDAFIQLGDDEYLMMGDNTRPNMSLDGRFFGGVPRADFQGPAIFVYWPFRSHWGVVR